MSTDWVQYAILIGGFFTFVFASISIYIYRRDIDFWRMDAWYSLPFVGKLDQLARQRVQRERNGWLTAESSLCSDYSRFTRFIDNGAFDRYRTYLTRARDIGRKPLHPLLLAVLMILEAAEAFGFSYILAGTLGANMSAQDQTYGTIALIIVLCLVMLWLTHAAGRALYKNLLIGRCEKEQDEWNQQTPEDRLHEREPLYTVQIKLDDDQEKDGDGERKWFTQCMNRINREKNWVIVIAAVAAILILGAGQTWLRFTAANKAATANVAAMTTTAGMPMFDNLPLPGDLVVPQQAADGHAKDDLKRAQGQENVAGFTLLAFIYIITQGLAIYTGYQYGFGGEESEKAYRQTRGAGSYDEYMTHFHKLIGTADAKLLALHQKIQHRGIQIPFEFEHTYDDWLKSVREREDERARYRPPPREEAKKPTSQTSRTAVDDALARLDNMPAENQRAFMGTLDSATFDAVVSALRDRRAKVEKATVPEEERKRREGDLDDLFG